MWEELGLHRDGMEKRYTTLPSSFKMDPRDHLPLEKYTAHYKKPVTVRIDTFK